MKVITLLNKFFSRLVATQEYGGKGNSHMHLMDSSNKRLYFIAVILIKS